jgi:DNA-directed RNA polymerase alpha subunit
MPLDEPVPGPIDGLRLPRRAWKVLQQENIITLDQLRAIADRLERVLPGIGGKTALTIRTELARVKVREKPRHYRGHWTGP